MPFRLIIDSVTGTYKIVVGRFMSGELVFVNAEEYVDLKLFFWKKRFNLFEMKSGKSIEKSSEKKVEKSYKKEKRSKVIPFRKVLAIVKSFKVNRFRILINTDDMMLNGILYPLVYWLAYKTRKDIGIVFYGPSIVRIDIENNLAHIAWAYIKTK